MKLPPSVLGPIVNSVALAHNLRPDIVMCIIFQESACETSAYRFEPHIHERLLKMDRAKLSGFVPPQMPNLTSERWARAASWGLMQVLGETARWCAKCTNPYLSDLCNPEIGVDVGCRVLSFYLGRHKGDYARALAAYNAGNPDFPAGQKYAREVLARLSRGEHTRYLQGK